MRPEVPAIAVTDLAKTYRQVTAVDGVSFAVPRGAIVGLLGGNGAGKTTTIAMIMGLVLPDSGTAKVLGIDMAHMGLRYGDPFAAEANQGIMQEVERRDRDRIARVSNGDPDGFWNLVAENGDDLKWCGSSPLYTFMKAVPHARAVLRGYEQWNIDERSVVSFGALAFRRG